MENFKYYIAYGSNLNITQMKERCPNSIIFGKGQLLDYQLVFKAIGKYAYATIEPFKGNYVPIGVWKVSKQDERSLDEYEDYPNLYYKTNITVEIDGVRVCGMIYIMNENAVHQLPSKDYFQGIVEGYDNLKLEKEKLYEAYERSLERR